MEYLSFLLAFALILPLTWAAISDIRTREIPDTTHVIVLGVGAVVWLLRFIEAGWSASVFMDFGIVLAVMIGLWFLIEFTLYRWGLMGGGDAKMLVSMVPLFFPQMWGLFFMFGVYAGVQIILTLVFFKLIGLFQTLLMGFEISFGISTAGAVSFLERVRLFFRSMKEWEIDGRVVQSMPYGVAIALSVIIPALFNQNIIFWGTGL